MPKFPIRRRSVLAVVGTSIGLSAIRVRAASAEPIKLAMLLDLSSVQADTSGKGSIAAAQMAIDDVHGQVAGRPIQLLTADHQNKPDIAMGIARRWLDVDKVDAFIEVQNSAVAVATSALVSAADRVVLMSTPGSSDLTGKYCTKLGIQWTWDGYAATKVAIPPLLAKGVKKWFFITPDYNFGHSVSADARRLIEASSGSVVGETTAGIGMADFSSMLVQAQSSGAQAIMANPSGADCVTVIKQAKEFGILDSGIAFVSLVATVTEVEAVGLATAHGLLVPESFYWDLNEATRAWSKRFLTRTNRYPNSYQAGVYGEAMHIFKAIEKAGTTEGAAVRQAMAEIPINDMMTKDGSIRPDGRVLRDMYLFRVNGPAASKYEHDFYELVATVPGNDAFRPMADGGCALVR
jgi:branched-chain amino acid transport system substrate-binding protein